MTVGTTIGKTLCALLLFVSSAEASGLKSPYASAPTLPGKVEPLAQCPGPLPPVRDLDIRSGFNPSDYTRTVPALVTERAAKTEQLHRGLALVVDLSNRTMQLSGADREAARACVLDLMTHWFDDGLLLGQVSWPDGEYERGWLVVALGLSYLQLYAGQASLPPAPDKIKAWFMAATDNLATRFPLTAPVRNNHWYWAGLSAVVAGTISEDRPLYDYGIKQYAQGLAAVDADGYLPLELERGGMAFQYHVFSASALTFIAAFAQANGDPLQGQNKAALMRLVGRILKGLADPSEFARLAGASQVSLDPSDVRGFAWLELYDRVTKDPAADPWLRLLRPLTQVWVGGSTTVAFGKALKAGPTGVSPLISD